MLIINVILYYHFSISVLIRISWDCSYYTSHNRYRPARFKTKLNEYFTNEYLNALCILNETSTGCDKLFVSVLGFRCWLLKHVLYVTSEFRHVLGAGTIFCALRQGKAKNWIGTQDKDPWRLLLFRAILEPCNLAHDDGLPFCVTT